MVDAPQVGTKAFPVVGGDDEKRALTESQSRQGSVEAAYLKVYCSQGPVVEARKECDVRQPRPQEMVENPVSNGRVGVAHFPFERATSVRGVRPRRELALVRLSNEKVVNFVRVDQKEERLSPRSPQPLQGGRESHRSPVSLGVVHPSDVVPGGYLQSLEAAPQKGPLDLDEGRRLITPRGEDFGKRREFRKGPRSLGALTVLGRITRGQERGDGRHRPGSLRDRAREPQPLPSDPVDVGGGTRGGAIAAQGVGPQGVDEDEHDVWSRSVVPRSGEQRETEDTNYSRGEEESARSRSRQADAGQESDS